VATCCPPGCTTSRHGCHLCCPVPGRLHPDLERRGPVSSWRRIPDECLPGRAEIVGSFVNAALAKTEAAQPGCDEALMLGVDGNVAEATTSNVGGELRWPDICPGPAAGERQPSAPPTIRRSGS
jgi:Amino-transferase class IV